MISDFRNIPILFATVGLTFVICFSCGKSPPNTQQPFPRLVILYATCSVNKNYLSPYNKSVSYTPNIENLARKSIVFTNHITEAGQSGPSYASIFSGTQADRHGVYRHPTMLPDDLLLISEVYDQNGYETFFWNRHPMASSALNYGQGVKWENTFNILFRGNSSEFLKILRKLKANKNYKAFVMVNFSVTHSPYKRSKLKPFIKKYPLEAKGVTIEDIEKYDSINRKYQNELQWNFSETVEQLNLSKKEVLKLSKTLDLLYKSNIWRLDSLFGELVEQVEKFDLLNESLIVFTADHGEILYRENALFKWTHGFQLSPEALEVPLIIYSPKFRNKMSYYENISRSIDVYPTMIGLTGLSLSQQKEIKGVNLSLPILGLKPAPKLLAYSHTSVAWEYALEQMKEWTLLYNLVPRADVSLIWVSIRDKNLVYKFKSDDATNWNIEVFDLYDNPVKTTNPNFPKDSQIKEMEKELRAYKERLVKNYHHYIHAKSKERVRPLSKEKIIKTLRSLGYIR